MGPVQKTIVEMLQKRGTTLRAASQAIGRNDSFLHQFVNYGKPKMLSEQDRKRLAEFLAIPEEQLGAEPSTTAPRRLPVARLPLNANESPLNTIEQAARLLAPLAKDCSPAMMALLLKEWLDQLKPPQGGQ